MQSNEVAGKGRAGLRTACHPRCIACSGRNHAGLGLEFRQQPDGSVTASFSCDPTYQGYTDCLHGGIVAMLFDAAMTNCLFCHGLVGMTARLTVAFRNPVCLNEAATIRAYIAQHNRALYLLKAELWQQGAVKARAEGKFMQRTD